MIKFGIQKNVGAFARTLIERGLPPSETLEFWKGARLILRGTAADFARLPGASEPPTNEIVQNR